MKTLLILRHAKSSWKHEELADHDRPLKKRGEADAVKMGELHPQARPHAGPHHQLDGETRARHGQVSRRGLPLRGRHPPHTRLLQCGHRRLHPRPPPTR